MSDLTAAMQAAVDSIDVDRSARGGVAVHPGPSPRGVQLRDEHSLPPIAPRRGPRTFSETLRDQYGPIAVTAWTMLREAVAMVGLFWICAILLAFVEVEGVVYVPGVGEATVITVALVAATILRAVLAAASRSGQALESRLR